MSILAIVLAVLCAGVTAAWTGRHLTVSRSKRVDLPLTGSDAGPPGEAPMVSVLVAAKDEKDNIEPCVRSLLAQDYPRFEVIVIDDRSTDGTSEIVRRIAEEDSRLRVLTVKALPPGWYGKNHAMSLGAAEAAGEYLVMIDADCCHHSTRSLSVAVQHAVDHDVDLLSILPRLTMRGFWENIVQPVCGVIMLYWFQPERVNRPHTREAYANGAFMMFRRSAYEAVGGHASIRGEMMEDLRLAERVKTSGRKLRVVSNDGLFMSRMYTSLSGIVAGWARIFWGSFTTKRRLRLSMIMLVCMGVVPYFVAALGWAVWAGTGAGAWLAAAVAGTVAAASQVLLISRLYKVMQTPAALSWAWPLGCVVATVSLVKAYRLHRPRARFTWRDTTYAANADG